MPQYDAFLSYARADDTLPDGSRADYDKIESFVRGLYDALTAADLKIWWDRECLPSQTTPFSAEIERGLHDSARVVLIVGPGAAASPWVQAEVREALRQCKAVTPLLVKGDFNLIPDALKLVSQIDARPPREFKHVIDDLLTELGREDRLGTPYGVRPLPSFYLPREGPYEAARAALVQDAISATVISAPPRAAAIYGMGGVGKSTLATALAEDCSLRRHFKDGILWVEVGQTPTVTDLQAAVGVTLGDDRERYQKSTEARIALSQTLHRRQALIVLDDVWDHRLIEDFPVSGTACRLLVTTRSGTLAGAIQGADIRLELLTEAEGAALLAGTAGGAADNPVYRQLSAALGGQTLAVALAAARLKKRGPAYARTILDGLDDPTNPFTTLAMHKEDKDLNVEKSLWQSYRALEPDQQRRYRLLGVLTRDGSFDLKLAAALWGESEAAADRPLEALLDADLVQSATEGRYQQHRLLHAYARALLHREGEYDDAFGRYADWVIAFSQQFKTLPPEQWGGLEPDLPHVHEVGDTLVKLCASDETYLERGLDFATNVSWYLFRRRQVRRLDWLEMGLQAARQLALKHPDKIDTYRRRESLFLNELAVAWSALGEKRKALDFYEQALPLSRAVGDRGGEATTLNNIGGAWDALGEKRVALDFYEQALPLRRAVGDRGGEATTLNNIGLAWDALGEKRKALDFYEQALSLDRELGDRGGEATTLNNIGGAWDDLGEKRVALDFYEQALPLRRAVGDRGGEAATLNNIGGAWDDLGEKRKALDFYEQALSLYRDVGDRGGEAATLNNIGLAWSALGEQRKALDFYEQALPLSRAVGDRGGEATTLNNIGGAWRQLGESKKALGFYEQALPLSRAVGDRGGEAATLNNIGKVWDDLGEKRKALDFYEQALPLFKAVGDRGGEATTLNNMAAIYFQEGSYEKVVSSFEQIIAIFQPMGAIAEEAAVRDNLAVVLQQLGRTDEAISELEQAIKLLRERNLDFDAGGTPVADMEQRLREWRGEPAPSDPQAEFARQIMALYQQGGAAAVRQALVEAGASAEVIDNLIVQVESALKG